MRNSYYVFLCLAACILSFCCCSDENEDTVELTTNKNVINIKPISVQTKSFNEFGEFTEGYHCTSPTSSLDSNIYIDDDRTEVITLILNKENIPAYFLRFKINEKLPDSSVSFTAFNELNEPIMDGLYNDKKSFIEFTRIYGNDVITRASARSWGCNLSLWACGTIWSIAVGSVSMGAGALVGLAYTAAAVQICDGL